MFNERNKQNVRGLQVINDKVVTFLKWSLIPTLICALLKVMAIGKIGSKAGKTTKIMITGILKRLGRAQFCVLEISYL